MRPRRPDRQLHDPDARPIAKAAWGTVEFGYKARWSTTSTDRADHSVHQGTRPTAPIWSGHRGIAALFGRGAGGDRGSWYGEAKIEQSCVTWRQECGDSRKAKPCAARSEVEHERGVPALVKWRTGSEGLISYLSVDTGWDRTCSTHGGAQTWCGPACSPHQHRQESPADPGRASPGPHQNPSQSAPNTRRRPRTRPRPAYTRSGFHHAA